MARKRKEEERKAVPKKELQEKPFVEVGSEEEATYIRKLSDDIAQANIDYVNFVADHTKELSPDDTHTQQMKRMMRMRIFASCVMPLQRGINAGSIMQAVGMYAGVCLVDKGFKQDVHRGVSEMLLPHVRRKAAEAGPDSKWAKRVKDLERGANGGRDPYDAETAALTEIGFLKKAYQDMRMPGADVKTIMEEYNKARDGLYSLAAKDGVPAEEIMQMQRYMVGKICEHDPSQLQYFNETVYSDISMDSYHEENVLNIDAQGRPYKEKRFVWSGEFSYADGEPFEGSFTPRVPMTAAGYESVMCSFYESEFTKAQSIVEDEDLGSAYDSIYQQVTSAQADDHASIEGRLHAGRISKGDAAALHRKVESLDGFDMSAEDMTNGTCADLFMKCKDVSVDYVQASDWHKVQRDIKCMAMYSDGLDVNQAQNLCRFGAEYGAAKAVEAMGERVIDNVIADIKADYDANYTVNSSFHKRQPVYNGPEEDLGGDYQYGGGY